MLLKVSISDLTLFHLQAEVQHKDYKMAQTCCFESHYQAHVVIFACSLYCDPIVVVILYRHTDVCVCVLDFSLVLTLMLTPCRISYYICL